MATVAETIEPAASTSIAVVVAQTPVVVLTDEVKRDEFYAHIQREVDAFEPDVSTAKGREAIKALAYKITRTKTAIDAAGKQLNEDARARINAVDAARRDARAKLETMAEEVRRPLTAWEETEKEREALAAQQLDSMRQLQRVDYGDDAASVQDRIDALHAMTIDAAVHRAAVEIAENARAAAIATLQDAHARLVREEQERAELERFRAAAAERERLDAERRAQEEDQRRRQEAEKAEQDRIARLEQEAEARAKREAERQAQEDRDRLQREHDEALAAERRRAEDAERAAQAERDLLERDRADRAAAEKKAAADQARREANRAHRTKIMGAAKAAIIECGVDEPTAKAIVLAIAGNGVPHVSIQF